VPPPPPPLRLVGPRWHHQFCQRQCSPSPQPLVSTPTPRLMSLSTTPINQQSLYVRWPKEGGGASTSTTIYAYTVYSSDCFSFFMIKYTTP
jgi:hypothetical protein